MSMFLPPKKTAPLAVAICARCNFKVYYTDLKQDPNTKMWVCGECLDKLDPYKLPPRKTEDISLQHPRPDTELT